MNIEKPAYELIVSSENEQLSKHDKLKLLSEVAKSNIETEA